MTAPNVDAPGPAAGAAGQAQGEVSNPILSDADAARKRWSTAQAEALLVGFTAYLTETDDGRPQLICSRWALTRAFEDLLEFESWLARVKHASCVVVASNDERA